MNDPQNSDAPANKQPAADFDPEEKAAEAVSQFLDLQSQGEAPEIEAFCQRHPSLQPALRNVLEIYLNIDQALEDETPPASIPASDEADALIISNPFPGYKLLRRLGSGGMGRVYLAEDERLRRPVAIKVLLPSYAANPSLRRRFLEEARSLAKINHPGIASIFSLGEETETPYFVMEYIEGLPLNETARSLPLQQKLHLFYQVLEAAAFLHDHHLRELDSWRQEEIISPIEYDSFHRRYNRLIDREDAWIMEMRQLVFSQVTLYLGGWLMTVGAILLVLFNFQQLNRHVAALALAAASGSVLGLGLQQWHKNHRRIGIAFLLTFTLLFFIGMLVTFNEYRWFSTWTQGRNDLEFLLSRLDFEKTTNAQLWWALLALLPVCFALRRYTNASVFSLELTFMSLLLACVTLLRMGMLDWLSEDQGRPFLYMIPMAIIDFGAGYLVERLRSAGDSRYLYSHAVFVTYLALSGIALYHKPYAQWLEAVFSWTRGQVEYLFILNALFYWVLQFLCDHAASIQLLSVAKVFRFVIAGHILIPIWALSITAMDRWSKNMAAPALKFEARLFEVLLPLAAALFIYYSISRQMKNYFAGGMIFLAVGLIRLEEDWLKGHASWPLALIIIGFLLMLLIISRTTLLKLFLKFRRR